MSGVPRAIERFVARRRVLTLGTCVNDEPWSSHCFYVYLAARRVFVFASDSGTRHMQQACHNVWASGGIVLESRRVGRLRGLQMQGYISALDDSELATARRAYCRRFPLARVMDLTLWQFVPTRMKYTDNRLGFGTKLQWTNESELSATLCHIIGGG